jgi:hypothetical protein
MSPPSNSNSSVPSARSARPSRALAPVNVDSATPRPSPPSTAWRSQRLWRQRELRGVHRAHGGETLVPASVAAHDDGIGTEARDDSVEVVPVERGEVAMDQIALVDNAGA